MYDENELLALLSEAGVAIQDLLPKVGMLIGGPHSGAVATLEKIKMIVDVPEK